jgi:hypothetical protein
MCCLCFPALNSLKNPSYGIINPAKTNFFPKEGNFFHRRDKMNESQEIIAKALEIAITLTGANHKDFSTDENNVIQIRDPLYTTLKTVIRIMNTESLLMVDKSTKIFHGVAFEAPGTV